MAAHVRQALVGMGSNLGERAFTLRAAATRLRDTSGITWVETSSLYETLPVGKFDQPLFLNATLGVDTTLAPEEMLHALQQIESEFGRVRTVRWGPRTLDLDLLAFEGEGRSSEELQLPHPRMLERGFVVIPLRELLARPRFSRGEWSSLRKQLESCRTTEGVRLVGAF
jgi:2-amino-4-hydroxy-6-hydroxymethyldihydropteridine diphosphokinase